MSICSSLFFGSEGNYSILGQQVEFRDTDKKIYSFSSDFIGQTAEALLTSSIFRIGTLGYLHTFIHEMGHALVGSILTQQSASITIYTKTCLGQTSRIQTNCPINDTLISLGGPLADIVFSIMLIFAAFAFQSTITAPVAIGICAGATIWILGEFLYAVTSLVNKDGGDFASISRNGPLHLLFATSTIVGVVAAGVFAISKVR